jgi:hypothetical protein
LRGAVVLCLTLSVVAALPIARAQADPPFLLLKLEGSYVKWGAPVLGSGATVRYSLVTKRVETGDARNCEAMVPLAPALERFGIGSAQLEAEAAAAFAMWERAADIRFERVNDIEQADILIGGQEVPRGRAFANVSYRNDDQGATRRIDKSLICLNQMLPWKIGFGGNANAYDIRYTIAHEIGHAIGLNHPGPSGQLMAFKYSESFRGLQAGDLDGAVALYGSRNSVSTASARVTGKTRPAEFGLR